MPPARGSGTLLGAPGWVVPITACLLLACLQYVAGWNVPAGAVPAIAVAQDIPGDTLIGRETPVELTFTNPEADRAFILAFYVRLPLGVSVSSADQAPSLVFNETDAAGQPVATIVAWENIVDIVPGGLFRFRYSLAHETGDGPALWSVGEVIQAPVQAFVNDADAVRPQIGPSTGGNPVTVQVTDFTQSGGADGSTILVPLLLTKSEPSTEGELLRGVHDHQTVYTLTAQTGSNPTGVGVGTVEDWIPAGLEFLGCGTGDNSLTEEYPGAGALNPGNAPEVADCLTPDLVETVDSGLPAGLEGVHTHVVWDIGATVAPDTTVSISYVAGIPQRRNTMTWPNGRPSSASGNQGSNLDNNTGLFTTQVGEGQTYTNYVAVDTDFEGVSTTVDDTEVVQAVDLSVHKFVDTTEIEQGAISTWQLYLETSEYVVDGGVAGLVLTDVTPDGTCVIGSGDPRCIDVTQPDPVPAYSSVALDQPGPGETTLTWDAPGPALGRSEVFLGSFATVALTEYADGAPVSANDHWTNEVDLDATVTTFGPDGPDEPAGFEPNGVVDESSQSQSGTAVSFRKDVGRPAPGQQCGDGTAIEWNPERVSGTGPGDRVCFRLTADPPPALDTIGASLTDFLPPGFRYEDGSSTAGPDNQVPLDNVLDPVVTGTPEIGQRIDWAIDPSKSVDPDLTAQVVFSAVLDGGVPPDDIVSGDLALNAARVTYHNTNGEIFVDPDAAGVDLTEAHLALTKGISMVDPPGAPPPITHAPPIDSAQNVAGGTAVTFALDVSNDGTSPAIGVEVRDLLSVNDDGIAGLDAVCAAITAISNGGTCSDGDITWTGLTVPVNGTLRLTYTWTLPDPVPVATGWTNQAGVVEYRTTTNTGPDFVYVPRQNIDPGREEEANTDPARDDAHLYSPGITMVKTRTTAVGEPGNALSNQATIGEVVSFTVETRQSANTSATDYLLTDDLRGRGLDLLESTVQGQLALVAPGAPCTYPDPPITPGGPLTAADDVITWSAAGFDLGNQDGCAVLRFDAVVEDVPDPPPPAETLNRRPGFVRNEAVLTYDIAAGGSLESGRVTARVDTRVVEPNIRIDKRPLTTGTALPGTHVDYELTITNLTDSQVSTAHDLVVVDDFAGASVAEVVGNPDGGVVSGSTITWDLADDPDGVGGPGLAPGRSVQLHYTVRLQDNLVAGAALTNTARVVASSLLGASPLERTDASPCSTTPQPGPTPAPCPGYEWTDPATITVGGPILTKNVFTQVHTIGDGIVYGIEAFFPAHLDFGAVTIGDDLAAGSTTFLETLGATCTGCSDEERAAFGFPPENSTEPPEWDLGVLPASDVPRRVFIYYRVRVEDDPGLVAGETLTNTARLDYPNGTLTDTAVVRIEEPAVSMVKRVATAADGGLEETTPTTPKLGVVGGTITYELAITNDGEWTAYDVVITDEPDSVPAGVRCEKDARLTVISVTSGEGWEATDRTLGEGDSCVGFRIPALLPGKTIRIIYQLLVPEDFPRSQLIEGNEFVNVARVTDFHGLAETEREDNPDARDYLTAADPPILDEGHVDLLGGVLGDLVWLDVDGDGLGPDTGDEDEPGIPGVTVTISGPGGLVLTRTTDAQGRWTTDNPANPSDWLAEGSYTITVDPPPGLTNTADPDGGLDSTAQTDLAENEVDLDQDFGYTGTRSLGDRVWLDLDADGEQDPGEPGIPDVDLAVTFAGFDAVFGTADDVDYGTTTTGPDGGYLVEDLPPGRIRVVVDAASLPDGVEATYDLDGVLDGETVRELGPAENADDVDFGYAGTGSVGDLVWFDLDADGDQELGGQQPGEPGISGVGLAIVWAGFDGDLATTDDNIAFERTTGEAGRYLVEHLPAGPVRVTVDDGTVPGGMVQTFDRDGTLDHETVVSLADPMDVLDADFGYTGALEIGDLVWLDVDADGLGPQTGDPDEPGLPDQRVDAVWAGRDGELGTPDDVELIGAVTDGDGLWSVPNVPAGLVRVSLRGAPASTLTVTADPDDVLDGVTERTITQSDDTLDFGLAGTGSIGDLVWVDVDRDGTFDAGEPPIPGVRVSATWAGFDGALGTEDDLAYGTATTGTDGLYRIADLPPGLFQVSVDPATVPPGLAASFDLDGGNDQTARRTLTAGEDASDVDFGYRGLGRVGDLVWWDLDADGVQDAGEPGLPNVRVTLDWSGFDDARGTADDARLVTTTDASGAYLFSGLPAGGYLVGVDTATLPGGMAATFDADGGGDSRAVFTLPPGASNLTLDFGYAGRLSVGDLVWRDIDPDGERQRDEPALGQVGLTVRFLGQDGVEGGGDDVTIATRTAVPPSPRGASRRFVGGTPLPGEPFYRVTGLVPGSYDVLLDPATLPSATTPRSDRDGGDPAATSLVLGDQSIDDADFGVFRNAAPEPATLSETTGCGDVLVVDPVSGVEDANDDELELVPGSVRAPDGVDVEVTPAGDLRITTRVDTAYSIIWKVRDPAGRTAGVTLEVDVDTACTDDGGPDDPIPDGGSTLPSWWIALALALLLAGLGLLTLARRRR